MRSVSIGMILFALCAIANADLVDDFESGDLSKWSLKIFNNWGQTVEWDLVQDGTQVWEGSGGFPPPGGGGGGSIQYLTGVDASDVSVTAMVKTQSVINPGYHSGIVARYTDPSHHYELTLTGDDQTTILTLAKSDNYWSPQGLVALKELASTVLAVNQLGSWNTLRLDVIDNQLTAYFNDTLYFDVYDDSLSSGSVGLRNGAAVTRFDDFSMTVVPLPGAAILGSFGLSFAGWWLRRRAT